MPFLVFLFIFAYNLVKQMFYDAMSTYPDRMLETYTLAGGIAVVCRTISHPQPPVADGSR